MKRLALAIALISSALLSGCIIVPAHRHHRDGGYYRDGGYHRDGGYYRGSAYIYGQTGPR
jgi:hypothetical protein